MKLLPVITLLLCTTFLFSQNEERTDERTRLFFEANGVISRKTSAHFFPRGDTVFTEQVDKYGNVLSNQFIYDSIGELVIRYDFDSCGEWSSATQYQYKNGKQMWWCAIDRDSILTDYGERQYDSLGRLSVYYYAALAGIQSSYEYNTARMFYSGDTVNYYSSAKALPDVYIEKYNECGLLTEYTQLNKTIEFKETYEYNGDGDLLTYMYLRDNIPLNKRTYEYDCDGNMIAENAFDGSGQKYSASIYFYDTRNLLYRREYYNNDLIYPAAVDLYEYTIKQ